MQDFANALFVGTTAILGIALLGGVPLHYRNERRKAKARAELQFQTYRLNNGDGSLLLDGKTAQVLDSSDSYTSHNGRVHGYVLTLFVLSLEGRHFVFKSSETGNPYVAPLTSDRAKLVLKGKYREITSRDA
jgi:hypothetical protein